MAEEIEKPTPESPEPTPPETQPEQMGGNGAGETNDETVVSMPSDAFKKRLERAENSAIERFLKELGISDKSSLTSLIESEKKRKEAEMSETEKLAAKLKEKDDAYAQAQAEIAALKSQQRTKDINDAVLKALQSKDVNADDPEAVLALLRTKHADKVETIMDEDGKINEKALIKAIEAVKASNPSQFSLRPRYPGSPSNHGGTPGTSNTDLQAAMRRQMEYIRRS